MLYVCLNIRHFREYFDHMETSPCIGDDGLQNVDLFSTPTYQPAIKRGLGYL